MLAPHPPRKKCNCEWCWWDKQFTLLTSLVRKLPQQGAKDPKAVREHTTE